MKQWMSITEGANYLKIPRSKLHREVKQKKIPSVRVGWTYLLKTADLDEYRSQNGHKNK